MSATQDHGRPVRRSRRRLIWLGLRVSIWSALAVMTAATAYEVYVRHSAAETGRAWMGALRRNSVFRASDLQNYVHGNPVITATRDVGPGQVEVTYTWRGILRRYEVVVEQETSHDPPIDYITVRGGRLIDWQPETRTASRGY